MRLTIRIYKRHDPDLLAFYYAASKEYDIKNKMKDILREYIKTGAVTKNELPEFDSQSMFSLPPKVNFHIPLDKEKVGCYISVNR